MRYLLVIVLLAFASAAAAHPHHDCQKDTPKCDQHEHPGGPS